MKKIDLKKQLKQLYHPSAKEVSVVDVPAMNFLMIDGEGDPNTAKSFTDAVETLFPVSYAIKFKVKKGTLGIDYGVMPLEGLWESDDMPNFNIAEKSRWKWTVMIMQPSFVTQDLVEQVLKEVKEKKNPAALPKLRWESFSEGRCAQIMHIGPFSEEGPTVQKVHRFIDTIGKRVRKHHEIYLSDIRKAAPATWKTVIRQPLR